VNAEHDAERTLLQHISTHWKMIEDPTKFVLRYAPAIRQYIDRKLGDQQDADDVAQDFLTAVLTKGFSQSQVTRGRFRDYLRAAIRNSIIDHLRQQRRSPDPSTTVEQIASPDEEHWLASWRACLIDKAWRMLRQHQRENPGNIYHTVLKLVTDQPDLDSAQLAKLTSQKVGRDIRTEAFRKQLQRAREKFAEFIIAEVRDTLQNQDDQELKDELRQLGLDRFVRADKINPPPSTF
jgi:RNA polymerase sigma-70 factor (ECF subfamily)